ncbi:alpha/beta hydrolase [Chelatococcus asaccharovorans]|uniref:alpha/beta hydrolase n=1 Tax=Chelatococcus asaccharovorans TaxID=28210 RepID=UPI00224C6AAA|nr:alpha/beta hydrolase [Chelatococcus asaccharovorans]CAH1653950.1 Arylformamidase [Chelatococcus asaccharovorans]CAH1694417.1 Arylformamidase [Chelatococcus asaccharovorans]
MTDAPRMWSSLSADEHEFQYNPQKAFPHFKDYQAARAEPNRKAREELVAHRDIAYGDHPLRKLDVYPAAGVTGAAPVHVFFHGGYWRAQDKENFAFIAGVLVPRGVTTVIVNYELCPASTLDGVVDSALAAVEWTHRSVADFGGDPDAVTLSGHSAGAHLGAEVIATDWRARGIDPAFVKGAVLISGIYDPAPAIGTSVNAELNLDAAIAARHDVERRAPVIDCPVSIIAGGIEPWHWIDQSFRYAHHLHRHGRDPETHVVPGYNHFDIIGQYLDPESPVMRAVLGQTLAGRRSAQ